MLIPEEYSFEILMEEGGLGDIVALTATAREIHRTYPGAKIRIGTGGRAMCIFDHNPHLIGPAPGERVELERLVHIILERDGDIGCNLAASFCRQCGVEPIDTTPEVYLLPGEIKRAERLLKARGRKPVIAVDVWSRASTRRWPFSQWAGLVERLKEAGWFVVEIGKRDKDYDTDTVEKRLIPGTDVCLVDRAGLRETLAVLSLCDLAVSCDTGTAHLAAAVGTPQVTIYSRSPWYSRAYWNTTPVQSILHPCVRCDRNCVNPYGRSCLSWIPIDQVFDTILLAKARFPVLRGGGPMRREEKASVSGRSKGREAPRQRPPRRRILRRRQARP